MRLSLYIAIHRNGVKYAGKPSHVILTSLQEQPGHVSHQSQIDVLSSSSTRLSVFSPFKPNFRPNKWLATTLEHLLFQLPSATLPYKMISYLQQPFSYKKRPGLGQGAEISSKLGSTSRNKGPQFIKALPAKPRDTLHPQDASTPLLNM